MTSWPFQRDLVLRPSRAAGALSSEEAFPSAAWVFLAYLLVSSLFRAWKPFDFPALPGQGRLEPPPGGLAFWMSVQVWQVPLAGLGIALTGWFARRLSGERLPRRLVGSILCALVPLLLIAVYLQTRMPRPLFGLLWLGLFALLWPGLKRVEAASWRPLAAWMLGINAVPLALTPLAVVLVLLRAGPLYQGLEYGMAFWLLGLATFGVSRVFKLPAARAFFAVLLGMVCEVLCLFGLYFLGLVGKPVLSVLLLSL